MSQLTVYAESDADKPILVTEDVEVIISERGAAGIRVERWQADRELDNDADDDEDASADQAGHQSLAEGDEQSEASVASDIAEDATS